MINYSIAIMSTKPGTPKAQIRETKAYGVAQYDEKLTFDQFCKHIASHNSPFSKGVIKGILTDAADCLREMLLAGNKVSLGDLGEFHVELATEGAKNTEDFSAALIKAANVRWTPGSNFQDLRKDATFQLVPSRRMQKEDIGVVKNTETIQGLE